MFASGNPKCVSILACGERLTAKCVSTCRNYHVSRRLDRVLKEIPLVSVRVFLCPSVEEWWTLNE